jgi:hypothetical protein
MSRFGASGEKLREATRLIRDRLQKKIRSELTSRSALQRGKPIGDRSFSAVTRRHVTAGWRTKVQDVNPRGVITHVPV